MNSGKTALELLQEQECIDVLSYGCSVLDKVMGRSLAAKGIIEIYGESGCGKTQVCLQVCAEYLRLVGTQRQHSRKVLFISSDIFPIKRFTQILGERYSDCSQAIMDSVIIKHVASFTEFLQIFRAEISGLQRANVSLVIVDAVTCLFRETLFDGDSSCDRGQAIYEVCKTLHNLNMGRISGGVDSQIGVICVNEVRSEITDDSTSCSSVAALGATWESFVTTRIAVQRTNILLSKVIQENVDLVTSAYTLPSIAGVCLRSLDVIFSSHCSPYRGYFFISADGCNGVHLSPEQQEKLSRFDFKR